MRLTCPNCHRAIEVVEPDTDVNTAGEPVSDSAGSTCPVCGSELPMLKSTLTFRTEPRQTIGQFEIRERVGQGQFGVVWKAWDTELDRTVALKIPRTVEIFEKGEELFRKEARAIAALDHPNIVRLYDVKREADLIVIVTEFVEGATLQRRLSSSSMTCRDAAQMCRQIADGLHHAHQRGITHRDIKPSNILLTSQGVPKISDFGLAKRDGPDFTVTMDGQILGTPAYMPPEQAKGHSNTADCRSDVYSLGVVLYEMMTGARPFQGSSRALLDQVISCDPRAPRKLLKAIPRDLETICLTAMAKEPERRYQTAAAFAADLQRYLNGEVIVARPASRMERLWKWSRRHPWQIATCVLSIAFLGVAAAWTFSPKPSPVPQVAKAETRTITIDTVPTNAKLVFYLRDPKTGEPQPETAIRPEERSKLTIDLPPGDYLVVAVLNDGRFHEVYRRVPDKPAAFHAAYRHLTWTIDTENQIVLPEIEIPELSIIDQMAGFTGSNRFTVGIKGDTFVPVHDRLVPPFYLDQHELTIKQFRDQMKRIPSAWDPTEVPLDENLPVTRLFHDEAIVVAEKFGKRLMSEAEYEYAATFGGTRPFPWGSTAPPDKWSIQPISDLVADRLPTIPPTYDLYSNVGEWTDSWGVPYPSHSKMFSELAETTTNSRVARGAPAHVALGQVNSRPVTFSPRHRLVLGKNELPRNVGLRMARSQKPRLAKDDFERIRLLPSDSLKE